MAKSRPRSRVVDRLSPEEEEQLQKAIDFLCDRTQSVADGSPRVEVLGAAAISIKGLHLPRESDEAHRCLEIQGMLKDYARRSDPSCPFSIAVFGPPGSGKSHCVRELLKSVDSYATPLTVNLSQCEDPGDLARTFRRLLDPEDKKKTSVVFFDEFDAPLDANPLGWLRWFLAPMQDSKFYDDGVPIPIPKAVFMFAGGTAATFAEFQRRADADPGESRKRKVPDFISRLRGFIDIQGINERNAEGRTRRAPVLYHQLSKRFPELHDESSKAFRIDREILEVMLQDWHYAHGARSQEALLDICSLKGKRKFTKSALPSPELRKLHLRQNRGPLDGTVVGISAGLNELQAKEFLVDLAHELFKYGAVLAYGGEFVKSAGTLDLIVSAAKAYPDRLLDRTDKRVRNYLAFPSFLKSGVAAQNYAEREFVEFRELQSLSDAEIREFGVPTHEWFSARPKSAAYDPKRHLAWAISLFRMRARLVQDIDALIVVGGKDGESWGRFSGIAEEVVLALALEKPVYVLGGRGGAARAVGQLLGLDETLPNVQTCLRHEETPEFLALVEAYTHCFRIPGHPELPTEIAGVREFLFKRAVTTSDWRRNGLDRDENRELFQTGIDESNWGRCVELIARGLNRLDWPAPSNAAP